MGKNGREPWSIRRGLQKNSLSLENVGKDDECAAPHGYHVFFDQDAQLALHRCAQTYILTDVISG